MAPTGSLVPLVRPRGAPVSIRETRCFTNKRGESLWAMASGIEREGRYAAMLERLEALEKERLRQAEARRKDSVAVASPLESAGAFQAAFDEHRGEVERTLEEIRGGAAAAAAAELKSGLDAVALKLAAMEKIVADASYFLPAYDIQASQAVIGRLKEKLEARVLEVIPKKKFSFRNKGEAKAAASAIAATVEQKQEDDATVDQKQEDEANVDDLGGNVHAIHSKQNCVIVHDSGKSSEPEVMLSKLSNCTVYMRGRFRALFFHQLKQCRVYVGPVTASILLEDVESCVFMLASHQIRVHSTVFSDFYLRVRSRPIVEHVSRVRFAPYALSYQGIEEDLKAANLAEETGLWETVDDFRWLRASASPNWSIIPPEERLAPVDGSSPVETATS